MDIFILRQRADRLLRVTSCMTVIALTLAVTSVSATNFNFGNEQSQQSSETECDQPEKSPVPINEEPSKQPTKLEG